ncbi:MAG: glycosyltransferase family 4 protein [Candidatus Omnitrophica bacterium]|nr:glycosyltransferase family 4 protein [Candidatus Omnitrophota bacterium]
MRIGFDAEVLTENKTAAAHYLSKLVEHLVRGNPRLEVVLFSSDKILVDYEPSTHFPQIKRVAARLPKDKRKDWPAKVLPGLLKEHAIDVFHAPVQSSLALFRPSCPSVITIFDLAPWIIPGSSQGLFASLHYKMRQLAWSRIATRMIAVSETVKKDIVRLCHVAPDGIVVTPLGCDEELPQGMSQEEETRILKKYGIDGKTYVVSVSGLDRSRRNPDYLLEAFAECHRFLPDDLYFVFTGNNYRDEGHFDRTLRKMEMLGIRNKVVVTGFVPERVFQTILANAAVSVVTPFYTGMPLAILDSFACGVPVVASDRGAIPEIAGEAAALIDPYDPSAIAGAIRRLIENSIEHESYAEKGLVRAKEFTWDKVAEKTLNLYQDILGASRSSGEALP